MKHTIKGFLYHVQYSWMTDAEAEVRFSSHATMHDEYWTLIGPYEFEVSIPDDFDIRAAKITSLRELKQNVQAEFAAKVVEIDRKINELLAIENEPAT